MKKLKRKNKTPRKADRKLRRSKRPSSSARENWLSGRTFISPRETASDYNVPLISIDGWSVPLALGIERETRVDIKGHHHCTPSEYADLIRDLAVMGGRGQPLEINDVSIQRADGYLLREVICDDGLPPVYLRWHPDPLAGAIMSEQSGVGFDAVSMALTMGGPWSDVGNLVDHGGEVAIVLSTDVVSYQARWWGRCHKEGRICSNLCFRSYIMQRLREALGEAVECGDPFHFEIHDEDAPTVSYTVFPNRKVDLTTDRDEGEGDRAFNRRLAFFRSCADEIDSMDQDNP